MLKVYISAALASASDLPKARLKYEQLARLISNRGMQPYLPHLSTDPARNAEIIPEVVFQTDLRAMRSSDIILALLDEPSLGVGAELAFAVAEEKTVVAVWEKSTQISRFLEGFLLVNSGITICRYNNLVDILTGLETAASAMLSTCHQVPDHQLTNAK